MTRKAKAVLWTSSALVLFGIATALALFYFPHRKALRIQGAVVVQDADAKKRVPIAGVSVAVTTDLGTLEATSNPSGFFSVKLPVAIRRGRSIILHFRHRDYYPLDLHEYVGDRLYIAKMVSVTQSNSIRPELPKVTVAHIRVRYTSKAMTTVNIGSAAQTFEVKNTGNVPCNGRDPCSPDGLWQAAIGTATLDAGTGNEFRNARVSCIAGPCPFTRIENNDFTKGGQKITASARDWSDTATFLVEAEVSRPMVTEVVHESYPVIFGRALNFTLPAAAEGVCIQADVAGETIIFPLGPALFLSWATCDATGNRDNSTAYRCELKPEYQFQ